MKILMIVTWYTPREAETLQAGVFHYEQSMNLIEHGLEVAIYYPFDADLTERFSAQVERGILTFRTHKERDLISNTKRVFEDFKKIRETFDPDIIHAHVAPGAGLYGVLLGKRYHKPVVLTEHNPIGLAGYDKWLVRNIAKYVYKNTEFNACVSMNSQRELKEMFPMCEFGLVYNGIIAPHVSEDAHQYRVDGYVNVAIVATFYSEWIKGYQFLLPAMKELKDSGRKIMLHIVGGGEYMPKYQELAKELGIEDFCIFYGNCDKQKVYDIVSQMDFNTSTSLIECSGVSVQEALMLGKPMLVTRSGGANSLVTEENAIVIDKESTKAIVDGMNEMIDRLEQFDADKIHEYADKNFEIGKVSTRYMEIYSGLLEN